MEKTPFAGLTRLAPGEPLSLDGYAFQHDDPLIADHLLEVGAVGHRHDGHAALADPSDAPTVDAVVGGGGILADTTVWATYTLIDADGGETRPVGPAVSVTTDAPLDPPDSGPAVALDTTAGGLLVNTYLYALTFTDGNGGETTLGPSSMVQRPPGPANARVQVSGLTALLTAAGAAGWRLWRSVGGGRWGFLAAGATDTYADDGSASPDCTLNPPTRNTTNGVNQVEVTVPNTQPVGTVSFRVYLSTDGSFDSPAVGGTYAIASAGTPIAYTTIDLGDGSPPDVSRAIGGAAKINALTDITNLQWLPPVANAAALPAVGNVNGDVRMTLDDLVLHVWDTSLTPDAWRLLIPAGAAATWKAPVADAAALPAVGNTHGDARVTLDDAAIHVWGTDDAWHIVSGGGGGAAPGWTNFANESDWHDDTSWGDPVSGFYKDGDDVVHLRGSRISVAAYNYSVTASMVMATLPAGSRPAAWVYLPSLMWDAGLSAQRMVVIQIAPETGDAQAGTVMIVGDPAGDNSFAIGSKVWLNNIEFRTT